MGRALLPGAALFEMAAAAGMALGGAKTDALPVLAQASISSPCQLSAGGAVPKLTCTLHPRCACMLAFSQKSDHSQCNCSKQTGWCLTDVG